MLHLGSNLCAENVCIWVLYDASCPSWDALSLSSFPMHDELVEGAVLEALVLDFDFPTAIAALDALHCITGTLGPLVEVAYNINFRGIRSPFAKHIAIFRLVQTKVEIAASKLAEVICASSDFSHLADSLIVTPIDGISIFCQSAVVLDEPEDRRLLNNLFAFSFRCGFFLCGFLCFL